MTATQYTVRAKTKINTLAEGRDWATNVLPDIMFAKKYNYDGHEFGPVRRPNKTYELFWYPKTMTLALELISLLDKAKQEASLEVLQ